MTFPFARPILVLLGFGILACGAVAAPVVHWKPQADMDNQLFPSLIIATANRRPGADDTTPNPDLLGDHYGLIGISIRSPGPKTPVKVTVHENSILNATSWSGTLPKGDHTYFIAPQISYKYDALRRVRQQTPLSVQIDLEVNGAAADTKSETVTLHSINDCPWAVSDDEATLADDEDAKDDAAKKPKAPNGMHGDSDTALGWMFAAYVNEDHPVIDALLKEALHTGIITNVDGYQDGKPEEVLRQVYAVWKVLQDRGIHYSDITTMPGGSEKVVSQYVRFVDDSLRNEQANCVDGSVLFASILRKMGLAPFLVAVPGHMYMGLAMGDGDDNPTVVCIETTLLGANETDDSLKPVKEMQALAKTLDANARANPAWKTFSTAVSYATAAFHKEKAKFDDEDNADYQIIDIAEARADGIMPIPFDRPDREPELPGGPTHKDPTPAKPLPTPFVKPPTAAPAPKGTPKPGQTDSATPDATPKPRHSPSPSPSPDKDGGGFLGSH